MSKRFLIHVSVWVVILCATGVSAQEICTCVQEPSGQMRVVRDKSECRRTEDLLCWEMPTGRGVPGDHFVNWGSTTAPEGTTLAYSGYGYASHFGHSARHKPIIVWSGDPGGSLYPIGDPLYFLMTGPEPGMMPPGIAAESYVKGAVVYVDAPTVVVWGSHLAPEGWQVLYIGYSMGGPADTGGPIGPICVNSESFEIETTYTTSASLIYGSAIDHRAPGDQREVFIKCAVCKKVAD